MLNRSAVLNKNIQNCILAAHHASISSDGLTFLHHALLSVDELIDIQLEGDTPALWELEKIRNFVLEKIRISSRSIFSEQDVLELCGLDPFPAADDFGHQFQEDFAWSYTSPPPDWPELKSTERLMKSFDAELPADAFVIRLGIAAPRGKERLQEHQTMQTLPRGAPPSDRSFPDPMLSVTRGTDRYELEATRGDEGTGQFFGGRNGNNGGRFYTDCDEFSPGNIGEYNGGNNVKRQRGDSGPYYDHETRDYQRRGNNEDIRQNPLFPANSSGQSGRPLNDARREQSPPGGWSRVGPGRGGGFGGRHGDSVDRHNNPSRDSGRHGGGGGSGGGGGGGGGGGQRGFITGTEKLRIEINDKRGGGGGGGGGGGAGEGGGGGAVKKSLGGKRPPNAFTPPWIRKSDGGGGGGGGADGGYADRRREAADPSGGEEVRASQSPPGSACLPAGSLMARSPSRSGLAAAAGANS